MNDQKLMHALSHELPSEDREAFLMLLKSKEAGALDLAAKRTVQFVRDNPYEIAGAILGSAAIAAAQHQSSKPRRGGLSVEQQASRSALNAMDKSITKDRAQGKEPGFSKGMTRAGLVGTKEMADVFAKHPVKGALTVIPAVAPLGWALGKMVEKSQIF